MSILIRYKGAAKVKKKVKVSGAFLYLCRSFKQNLV